MLAGICLITYQTLDNMDGKQARKTGSSSPLGMLVLLDYAKYNFSALTRKLFLV